MVLCQFKVKATVMYFHFLPVANKAPLQATWVFCLSYTCIGNVQPGDVVLNVLVFYI